MRSSTAPNQHTTSAVDLFEDIACPLCRSHDCILVLKRQDLNLEIAGEFSVWRCSACQHQYLSPRPKPSASMLFYGDEYDQYIQPEVGNKPKAWDKSYGHRKRLRLISRYRQGGQLIDVGCGSGGFLLTAKALGWHATGVEPSAKAAAICRNMGLEIISDNWDTAPVPPESADVVTMWEVLEHFHDPLAALEKAWQTLKPGGVLALSTPNSHSLDAKLFGPYWVGYELPRHLQIFSQTRVEQLLREKGFRVAVTAIPAGGFYAFNTSFRFYLRAHSAPAFFEKVIFSLPTRLLSWPAFWLLGQVKLGSSVTTIAVKEPKR